MTTPQAPTAKQQEWIAHLEQARQQNLSLQEYARRTGIKASSLYAVRKRLSKARARTATVPVSFAEVRMAGTGPADACVLHLAPGVRLQLPVLPLPQWLRRLSSQLSPEPFTPPRSIRFRLPGGSTIPRPAVTSCECHHSSAPDGSRAPARRPGCGV